MEIPSDPLSSDLWNYEKPTACDHNPAEEIDFDADYLITPHPYLQQWPEVEWGGLTCWYWYQKDNLEQICHKSDTQMT